MKKTFPIFLAFLVMGIADAMGPMSDAVKKNYNLSNVMATLLSFFVFIAFAAFSVPGGLLAARIGKKKLLLLGLGLNVVAMLIPWLMEPGFTLLLVCIFTLGVGTTFLQVAGNPIMRDVSLEGNYGRNLSFAQGVKGVGSTVSTFLVTSISSIVLFQNMGWRGVFPIFCVLMAITFIWVATLKVNETKADVPPSIVSSLSLLNKPVFALAVIGIFLYVGAEVCMGRFLLPLLSASGFDDATSSIITSIYPVLKKMGYNENVTGSMIAPAFFFLMVTIGRLLGGAVLSLITPRTFFRLSAAMGLAGGLMLIMGGPSMAIFGLIIGGLGFANIWPMLFSITVEEDPKRGSELSGLMCMAISGGAIVPLLMGKLVDSDMQTKAFMVPAACFAYLLVLSLKGDSRKTASA